MSEFRSEDDLPGKSLLVRFYNRSLDVICFRVNVNMHLQPILRSSHRSPVSSILKGHQRSAAPAAGDLRKEPVLDGIELGTIRRIMNHKKPDTQFVGKVHKILLDDSVRGGVGPSAITQDNEGTSIGVLLLEMFSPYSRDVVTDELGRVMANAQRHVTLISSHIVDAVRNNLAVREGGEVMVKGLEWSVTQCLPVPFEVPNHLLFLGVDADNGKSNRLGFFADGRDTLELFISVLDLLHGKVLIEGTLSKAKGVKDLTDEVAGDVVSHREKFTHDLSDTQGDPHHILILRKACRMRFDNLHDGLRPLRMLWKHALPASTRSADAAFSRTISREKFLSSILKSMCACSHSFTNFAVAEPLSLEVGGLRGQEPSSVSFVQRGHIRQIFWREDFWRGFRYHFKRLGITLKFTKNPPDFLYYIIDNQQIKSSFYRFFGGPFQGGFSTALNGKSQSQMAA